MRLTFNSLGDKFARNIGMPSYSALDATIKADFKLNLGQRYQLIFGILNNYTTSVTKTASTVASQQYYHNPLGFITPDSCYITIGSVKYPLKTIYDQGLWDRINAITIQASVIPQYIFPRASDFGIWPIPQSTYTITMAYFHRDRNIAIDDYTDGTVSLTNGSTTVTGASTTFTPAMVGRFFTVTSTTSDGQGYWYKVASYSAAGSITLETAWDGSNVSGASYLIGESPDLPEEGHIILVDGATADHFGGLRSDAASAQAWENKFWTGDRNNPNRIPGDESIMGGLLGLKKRYANRDNSHLVQRKPSQQSPLYKVWATTIS